MSFKIHLLIVSAIIVVMFLILKVVGTNKPEPVQTAVVETSPYHITIERANYGHNCRVVVPGEKTSDNYLQTESNKPKENNALNAASLYCNDKPRCEIPVNPQALNINNDGGCGYKILDIEFRCFTVDRPRGVSAAEGTIIIDCDKLLNNP